jgi:hypothetical protein
LSDRNYGGKVYPGIDYVHSLVTLGTPHTAAPSVPFESIEWCNRGPIPPCRQLAVGGRGFLGSEWGMFTRGSYQFCCPNLSDGSCYDGDGVTPIDSAIDLEGAEQMTLDGVTHLCWTDVGGSNWVAPELTQAYRQGRPWYGSDSVIDQWAKWLINF